MASEAQGLLAKVTGHTSTAAAAAAAGVPAKKDADAAAAKKKDGRTMDGFGRATSFIADLKDMPDDSPIKQGIACFCKWGVKPMIIIIMAYVWVCQQLYKVYKILPTNIIQIIFGVGLCFFGGTYFASVAAIEAALILGGPDMFDNLKTCYEEASGVAAAHLADDEVDADKNGIADVKEMSTNELINHKAKVAMMAVKDPQKLQQAMIALFNVWLAVIATLKFKFAKTVAISLGIAGMLSTPAIRILGPPMAMIMGSELKHWVPAIIDTAIKAVAVWVATWVQAVISAYYSGLRGGKMIAIAIFAILTERGLLEKAPDWLVTKPFDPDESFLDEVIQWPLAIGGLYYQLTHAFTLPFPWSLICLPLSIVEWILRWQVYT